MLGLHLLGFRASLNPILLPSRLGVSFRVISFFSGFTLSGLGFGLLLFGFGVSFRVVRFRSGFKFAASFGFGFKDEFGLWGLGFRRLFQGYPTPFKVWGSADSF